MRHMNLCHMALLCAALPGCALHAAAGAEGAWTLEAPCAWAREPSAMKFAALPGGAFEVRHAGGRDWCVNGFPRIEARRGDVFELTCDTDAVDDVPEPQPISLSAVLRDEKGAVLAWAWGGGCARPGRPI